jgi:hypothetical protein
MVLHGSGAVVDVAAPSAADEAYADTGGPLAGVA